MARITKKDNNKRWIILVVSIVVFAIFIIGILSVRVSTVNVVGNEQCSSEEIKSGILGGRFGDSSFIVWLKSKLGKQADIPFVQKYDIEFNSNSSITVTVYEKSLVGYIDYMGTCMYFDKDGIVVESSENKIEGIPKITGISFDYVLLHEKLPVDNEKVFNLILNITQNLKKHELEVDKIYVNEDLHSTVYIGKIKVKLGDDKDLSDKIAELKAIAPKFGDNAGTLDMTQLNTDGTGYILEKDIEK